MKLRVKQQMLINAVCSTRPGGVLELSTFNYFFAWCFFCWCLFFVRHKQSNNSDKQSAHASKSGRTSAAHTASYEDGNDWIEKVNQTVSNADNQDWEWGGSGSNDATASVSAQEVDPLTEYQVYKQFGYESKAAESLAGYLNTLEDGAPENWFMN